LFRPVNPEAVCEFMKTITLDRILRSLEILEPQICVPEEIARRARRALERMLEIV
jgi:quinolinate synthase